MNTLNPEPLPSAISKFHAGSGDRTSVKYPHLPKSIPAKHPHISYPSLMRTGERSPATKQPMGMTLPILTKMGGHPIDGGASFLPPLDGVGKHHKRY